MDFLADHYTKAAEVYKHDISTSARIMTSHPTFDKYYSITDKQPLYAAAILLHPSLRRSYPDKQWAKLTIKNKVPYADNAVEAATKLWEKYKPNSESTIAAKSNQLSDYDQFMNRVLKTEENSISDEFERFIKGDKVRITRSPLEWWLEPTQGDTYPNLQKFAIDVFSIPPMSTEPERLFSGRRRTVSWARCRLSALTVEMLECVKHWIKAGLDEPIEGEEDEEIIDL